MKNKTTKVEDALVLICFHCKKIKNASGCWKIVADYKKKFSERKFSHGVCEVCVKELYGAEPWYDSPNKVTP